MAKDPEKQQRLAQSLQANALKRRRQKRLRTRKASETLDCEAPDTSSVEK